MSENKNIKYALIGGAALVGAAVIYMLTSGSDNKDPATAGGEAVVQDDDELDKALDDIGEIEYEDGNVQFSQFLKIFEICSYHGKTQFAEQKK